MFEVVQVEALVILCLLCKGHEEANQEDGNNEDQEGDGVLEGAPDALARRLLAMFGRVLVVFLVPEVGEGYNNQAEERIKRVERVVDNFEGADNAVDLFWCGPVLLLA